MCKVFTYKKLIEGKGIEFSKVREKTKNKLRYRITLHFSEKLGIKC